MSVLDLIIFRNELLLLIRSSELSFYAIFCFWIFWASTEYTSILDVMLNKKWFSENIFIHLKIFMSFW